MASYEVSMRVRLEWENRKAMRAFRKVLEVLEDLGEDFAYRDDVQEAIRAGKYAAGHIIVAMEKKK